MRCRCLILAAALVLPVAARAQIPAYQLEFGFHGTTNFDGSLDRALDAAVEADGNVLVVDYLMGRVNRYAADGTYLEQISSYGGGVGELFTPISVAVDGDGDLWVLENGLNRVQKFDAAGNSLLHFGQGTVTGSAAPGEFNSPSAIAVGSDGSVFVTDLGNHRVQHFSSEGAYLGSFGSQGAGDGQFQFPQDIEARNGRLYVLDWGNLRVEVFEEDGTFVAAWGQSGSGEADFFTPTALTLDGNGNVHVCDRGAYRVAVFTAEGVHLGNYGSRGKTPGQFLDPEGIGCRDGRVYVVDAASSRVLAYDFATAVEAVSWGAVKLAFAR